MRKSVVILVVAFFVSITSIWSQSSGQYTHRNPDKEQRNFRNGQGKSCHNAKKMHKRKMRRMAAADGKITPRERKMLRRDRRRSI